MQRPQIGTREGDVPLAAYRLPRGRHGLPAEKVAENQRLRLLGAAAEVLVERGYARTTSRAIAARAGVSPRTFYDHFDDLGACLLAIHGIAATYVLEGVLEVCQEDGDWPVRLREAVDVAFDFLVAEPALAWLLSAEARAGEAAIEAATEDLIERLAELLRGIRDERDRLMPGAERHLIAGAFAFLSDRLAASRVASLPELAPELAELLALPTLAI